VTYTCVINELVESVKCIAMTSFCSRWWLCCKAVGAYGCHSAVRGSGRSFVVLCTKPCSQQSKLTSGPHSPFHFTIAVSFLCSSCYGLYHECFMFSLQGALLSIQKPGWHWPSPRKTLVLGSERRARSHYSFEHNAVICCLPCPPYIPRYAQ
jgi:hypothetical protein